MNTVRNASFIALSAFAFACSSADDKTVDIGDPNVGIVGETLSDFSGSWDGYAEAFDFEEGSGRVRVTIDAEGNGSVRFGDSAINTVSAEDPLAPYMTRTGFYQDGQAEALSACETGFEYPLHSVSLDARRLRFELLVGDVFTPWCSTLTSVASTDAPSGYAPSAATTDAAWCQCTQEECTGFSPYGSSHFDGALESDGQEFVGTLVLPNIGNNRRVTVRLTRQAE
jgi:hypothetical protein